MEDKCCKTQWKGKKPLLNGQPAVRATKQHGKEKYEKEWADAHKNQRH